MIIINNLKKIDNLIFDIKELKIRILEFTKVKGNTFVKILESILEGNLPIVEKLLLGVEEKAEVNDLLFQNYKSFKFSLLGYISLFEFYEKLLQAKGDFNIKLFQSSIEWWIEDWFAEELKRDYTSSLVLIMSRKNFQNIGAYVTMLMVDYNSNQLKNFWAGKRIGGIFDRMSDLESLDIHKVISFRLVLAGETFENKVCSINEDNKTAEGNISSLSLSIFSVHSIAQIGLC